MVDRGGIVHNLNFVFHSLLKYQNGPHHDQPVPAAGEMLHLLILYSFIGSCGVPAVILLVFLSQVSEAIDNHEGLFCAELLSFKHPHVANPRLQVSCRPHRCCEEYCVAEMWSEWCLRVSAGQPRRKMSAAFRAAVR